MSYVWGALVRDPGQRLVQQGLAVFLGAPFLHVGEVRLVRLDPGRGWGCLAILPRWEPAARAVPGVRDLCVHGKGEPGRVPVGAIELEPVTWCGFAAIRFAHSSCADP